MTTRCIAVCDGCDREIGEYESVPIHIQSIVLNLETCQNIYNLDFCSIECFKEWIRIIIEGAEE